MNLPVFRPTERLLVPLVVLGLYVAVGGFFLKEYLLWDSQWLLALVLAPLVAMPGKEKAFSPGLLLLAIALGILSAYVQNSTLYFFTFLVAFWCGAQLILGRISWFPLLLLIVASPVFKYVANILSFPLRMQLTDWAVAILNQITARAEAAGNIILVNGQEFSVDPACAGLSMLSLSLMLGVFILAHLQRTRQHVWPHWAVGLLLGILLLLNLVSNLLRILLLVWFKILPANPLHDVLGLLCLLFYTLIPFYLLARWLHPYLASPVNEKLISSSQVSLRGSLLLNYFLLLLLTGAGLQIHSKKPWMVSEPTVPQLTDFKRESLENGVTKYSKTDVLVYLKPVQAFYSTEHHPLVCWEGSGYTFRQVQQQQIGSNTVYVGELQKGKDTLFTAWWMDNGRHRTINQWDWRTRMLKGEAKYKLVNVTVAQQQELHQAIGSVMHQIQTSPEAASPNSPRVAVAGLTE